MKDPVYEKNIDIDSTHILLRSDVDVDVTSLIIEKREKISQEIKKNPAFLGYKPVEVIHDDDILEAMTKAGMISDTGPMASVAGSISQSVLEFLLGLNSKYSVVENGGDIALKNNRKVIIGVNAGDNSLSYSLAFKMKPRPYTYSVCTSSMDGPSKSFGRSDATIVFSRNASISDALATRIGNGAVGENSEDIIHNSLEVAEEYSEYYDGVMVIKDENIGKTGHIPPIVGIQ